MVVRWSKVINTGCNAVLAAAVCFVLSAQAAEDYLHIKLTPEQQELLHGQPFVEFPLQGFAFDAESDALPLIKLKITAETNLMRGHSLDLSASYHTWQIGPNFADFDTTFRTEFSVRAPVRHYLDFTQSIRDKAEFSAEKLFDKFIIDGAVGFNFTW